MPSWNSNSVDCILINRWDKECYCFYAYKNANIQATNTRLGSEKPVLNGTWTWKNAKFIKTQSSHIHSIYQNSDMTGGIGPSKPSPESRGGPKADAKPSYYVGVDVGTSSVRAAFVDTSGNIVGRWNIPTLLIFGYLTWGVRSFFDIWPFTLHLLLPK